MTFAEKFSKLRRAQNYTQEQFADLLGVSRQSVSKWESGAAYPETEKLIKIGEMFDCSIDYLLKDSIEDMSPTPLSEAKPKKKRGIVAAVTVMVSVLVITLLTAAFFPRTATITIRSRHGSDIEGDEYEITYKEIASVVFIPDLYEYSHMWGTWDMNGRGYGNSEFAIVDVKNIDKGTVGSGVFVDVGFDKLYLRDNKSGMWRIFIIDSCTDNTPAFTKLWLDKRNGEYYKYYVS